MKIAYTSNCGGNPLLESIPDEKPCSSSRPVRFLEGLFTVLAIISVAAYPATATELPENIELKGTPIVASVSAVGVQIYECKIGADNKLSWQFREPLATLLQNGKTIGHHYAGPSWEFTDGSMIKGKVAAQAPSSTADDIPLLRLDVVDHSGNGILSRVTAVQRVDTEGGMFSGSCDKANTFHMEPYTASYIFLAK